MTHTAKQFHRRYRKYLSTPAQIHLSFRQWVRTKKDGAAWLKRKDVSR